MSKKRKKKKAPVLPRLGPPVNLRPAGAHEDRRAKALERAAAAERDDEAERGVNRD